jgi:hypothetical protein
MGEFLTKKCFEDRQVLSRMKTIFRIDALFYTMKGHGKRIELP